MKPTKRVNTFVLFISILLLFSLISSTFLPNTTVKQMTYNEFLTATENQEIKSIEYQSKQGVYELSGELVNDEEYKYYKTQALMDTSVVTQINTAIGDQSVPITVKPTQTGAAYSIFFQILFFGGMIALGFWAIKKITSQNKGAMNFGNHRAKRVENPQVKFSDVAGYQEEKQELAEIVDFLQEPTLFTKMGARIPKGILLVGPPGTGKTLLAKSIAGEAQVPFYSISGSEFVEMFVGVGASRVRDLFKEAKKNTPAIIFIDEIDAVGRKRGNGHGGGNDEREQTLNQMLVEMDGFESNSGIVIIAATNREDVLDSALLRPGRFDRQVRVELPDLKTREEILKLHGRKKRVAKDVDIAEYAVKTSGFSGADLENLVNEAAIVAVREKKKEIDHEDILEAIDRIIGGGPAKRTRKYSQRDKQIVSFHETGHVVVGLELDDAESVEKVTIIPRGKAGGYAMFTPKEEQFFVTKQELLDRITGLVAGRASEDVFLKEISTGAHNDFERATQMARAMVTQYGMTDLGIYQYEQNSDLENPYKAPNHSNETADMIDAKVKEILSTSYENAKEILLRREEDVRLIAESLRKYETLTKKEIDYLLEHREMPEKNAKAEKYSEEEIQEIKKAEIRKKLKLIQKRQIQAQKDKPEIKVLTDEEIEIQVEEKYKQLASINLTDKNNQTQAGEEKEKEGE